MMKMRQLLILIFCFKFITSFPLNSSDKNSYFGKNCSAFVLNNTTSKIDICKNGEAFHENFGCTSTNFHDCCTVDSVHPSNYANSLTSLSKETLYKIYGDSFFLYSCILEKSNLGILKIHQNGKIGINCDLHYRANNTLFTCPFEFLYNSKSGECDNSYADCCRDDVDFKLKSDDNPIMPQILTNILSTRLNCPNLAVLPEPHSNAVSFPQVTETYKYAVEIKTYGTQNFFNCLKSQNNKAVMIEAYNPQNGVNPYLWINKYHAEMSGLSVSFYIEPTYSGKSGAQQLDEIRHSLGEQDKISFIWLKIMNPRFWQRNVTHNLELIKDFIEKGTKDNISIGIYSNWINWEQIVGDSSKFSNHPLLYTSSRGFGATAESEANFDDFNSFSFWKEPKAKRFGLEVEVCGLPVNRHIYLNSI